MIKISVDHDLIAIHDLLRSLPKGYDWVMWRDEVGHGANVKAMNSGYKSFKSDWDLLRYDNPVDDIIYQFNKDISQHECFSNAIDW